MGACNFYVHLTYYKNKFYACSTHSLKTNDVLVALKYVMTYRKTLLSKSLLSQFDFSIIFIIS
jgi:hypothetical protein